MRIVEVLTRQTEDIPSALLMPRWSIDNHALSTRH
jgi:hypothetical protein